jgi:predicted RNA-binding Zn-ribbon protein involved in translation (DUF1610 family)
MPEEHKLSPMAQYKRMAFELRTTPFEAGTFWVRCPDCGGSWEIDCERCRATGLIQVITVEPAEGLL